MLSFPQFLLESSICLLILYAFYFWVLRKETFFQLNRAYLLLSPLLAILFPILNIQLSQPNTNTYSGFETIIYPAISNAQTVHQYFWQQIERPTPAFSLTIADLLFALYIIGVLFMSIRLIKGILKLFNIIKNNNIQKTKGYKMVEMEGNFPASSFFSYVFWNDKDISEQKKLIFEHELVHIRQHHSIDVLLMEFWVILKWYNPLIYLYRNALQVTHEYIADQYVSQNAGSIYQYANLLVQQSQEQSCHKLLNTFSALIKKRLVMLGQKQSRWYQGFKYVLSIPLFAILMSLFSFNLVEEIPNNALTNSLNQFENYLSDFGKHTVLEIEKEKPYQNYLEWGGVEFPLTQKDQNGNIRTDVRILSPQAFDRIQNHSFVIRQLYDEKKITSFEILIENANGNIYEIQNNLRDLYQVLEKLDKEFSLYLKLYDEHDAVHYSLLSVSSSNNIYNKYVSGKNIFKDIQQLQFSLPKEEQIVQANDLERIGENQYYLQWGGHKIQALKSGNPLHEPYDIPHFSLDEFEELKDENFSMVYNKSCLLIDSVYTMVANEKGPQHRCKDQWTDDICHRVFTQSVEDNSTIYLVVKTKLGDLFSSIVSIGDESTLYLENEVFLSQMLDYTNLPTKEQQIVYQESSPYELIWGGFSIELSKPDMDSHFFGKIDLSKEDFLGALEHEPVLGLKNGSLFDNVSFEIAEYGTIESLTADASAYSQSEVVELLKTSIEEGDYIILDNIQYSEIQSDKIRAVISISDEPKSQEVNHSRKENSYQFHWGNIDLRLSENPKNKKLFKSKTQISIDDFKKSIEQEPVLTSRKEGVLFDFQFRLKSKTTTYNVESISNKPDKYLQSLDIEAIKENLKIGDVLSIEKVNFENMSDELVLNIEITEPTVENLKIAKYKERVVLDWGDYEFGIRQLNGDKREASQPPLITLKSDFFKNIVCNEPHIYAKGQKLNIKEAAVLVKETDYQENCSTSNWEERDCIVELLQNACEESQISLFFKTKEKQNYMVQFILSEGLKDEKITFGQDTTQVFNGFLKDYTKNSYKAEPQTLNSTNAFDDSAFFEDKQVEMNWGDLAIDFGEIKKRFRYFPLSNYTKTEVANVMSKDISVTLNQDFYPLEEVHIYKNNRETKEFTRISMDCYGGKCHLKFGDVERVLEMMNSDNMLNMSLVSRDSTTQDIIHVATIRFEFSNSTSGWNPIVKTQKLDTTATTFPFQMINRDNRHTIVRIDTTNQKYDWMVESYQKNPSVELIHIDDFKTYKRVIEEKDAVVKKENLKKVEVLTADVLDPFTYPDFYDLEEKDFSLYWKNIKACFDEEEFYCLEDFKKSDGDLIFQIAGQTYPIEQFEMHLVNQDSTAAQFISHTTEQNEIEKAIKKADEFTTIVIDQILFKKEEKLMRFPIRFLFYLE